MIKTPLKNEITDWLKSQKYWLQYAGKRLLEGENVNFDLVEMTYKFFKEDYSLQAIEGTRSPIEFNQIEINKSFISENLQLKEIKEVSNVNALAAGQIIQINKNLTIIYGANGTGKSGYVRLLNNAFNSRGDKHILPNVFSKETSGQPTCTFTFQLNEEKTYELTYPTQKNNIEFSQYSVFDTLSIRSILEQDNGLNFTPIGFDFFEKILELYESMKEKIDLEIITKQPANDFLKFFNNENEISRTINTLGADSNEEQLKDLALYTEENEAQLTEIITKRENLKGLDIPKKIKESEKLLSQIENFIINQEIAFSFLTNEKIKEYENLINSFHNLQDLARKEGIENLKYYEIEKINSHEWKEFIKASHVYISTIQANKDGENYSPKNETCIFCLQPLSDKEKTLINSYWNLLKSEAQIELNRVTQSIQDLKTKISSLTFTKFDEATAPFEYISLKDSAFAQRWQDISKKAKATIDNLILNLTDKTLNNPTPSITENFEGFIPLVDGLRKEVEELFKNNPSKDIKELDVKIQFLKDKSLLNKLLNEVLNFIASHKWAAKAKSAAATAFNTKSITTKQGKLFSAHITDKYIETFNLECCILNAPKVIQIAQKNTKGTTLRKLQVEGKVANSVLSEGEQRAIALADFLTEVQINPYNKGVFFDDPVTSQDHLRREKIAERLVDFSRNKQVVIFTHDIAFFIKLKIFAEKKSIPYSNTTIRNISGTPGMISPDLPWIAQPIKQRLRTLRDKIVHLKKTEKEGNEDQYLYEVKSWYELLREGWERAVEERLFKGVIERFSLSVQTQKLKNVIITQELLSAIEIGMTNSSSLIHDAAAGLNPTPPNTEKAEIDLCALEDFVRKCGPA